MADFVSSHSPGQRTQTQYRPDLTHADKEYQKETKLSSGHYVIDRRVDSPLAGADPKIETQQQETNHEDGDDKPVVHRSLIQSAEGNEEKEENKEIQSHHVEHEERESQDKGANAVDQFEGGPDRRQDQQAADRKQEARALVLHHFSLGSRCHTNSVTPRDLCLGHRSISLLRPENDSGPSALVITGRRRPKGSRKNNLAFCCGSHARLNHNWQTAIDCCVWEPQPYGARPELARDPRRCHHIACVAAPCICLPGARAKMPTYSCANPKLLRE